MTTALYILFSSSLLVLWKLKFYRFSETKTGKMILIMITDSELGRRRRCCKKPRAQGEVNPDHTHTAHPPFLLLGGG